MTFQQSISVCFHKYADFYGRASQSEYWWFVLFCFIVGWGCAAVSEAGTGGYVIASLVQLGLLLPSLAVVVRRLHDIGKSGFWILLGFIPLVGVIILIVWLCRPSQEGPNEYGVPPMD